MGFPIPSTSPVSGASFASLTVNYVSGYYPANDQACATFSGNTITIYQQAKDAAGTTVQCSTFGYSTLIAHELGHFYGLSDVYGSGCTSIMGQADGLPHSVTSGDCGAARNSKITPSENNSVYPTCQEPCAGGCSSDGFCTATTNPQSPIVVALQGNRFSLTGLDDPVFFDLDNDGQSSWTGWTAGGSSTAFLALDLNANGQIDDGGELFGNHTLLPDGSEAINGFVALSPYDSPLLGGNQDLRIDQGDAVFWSLRLWLDDDHDGSTDPGELRSLASHGITSISLEFEHARRIDQFGNKYLLRGSATRSSKSGHEDQPITIYDVFFVESE